MIQNRYCFSLLNFIQNVKLLGIFLPFCSFVAFAKINAITLTKQMNASFQCSKNEGKKVTGPFFLLLCTTTE